MWILLLYAVENRIHRLAQHGIELLGIALRPHRRSDRRDDRNLVAEQVLWMILGPDPVRAPDDHGNNRHLRLQRHPGRSGLELAQFEAAADSRLRV